MLHLRHGGDDPAVHLLARDADGELVGYAHVDTTDAVDGPVGRAGACTRCTAAAGWAGRWCMARSMAAADEPTRPAGCGCGRTATTRRPARWRSRSASTGPGCCGRCAARCSPRCPRRTCPTGVVLRAFRPGEDDEAWLALNARAFADHPEQGRWTLRDLQAADGRAVVRPGGLPAGRAGRDGELLGFHWTKVHGELRRDAEARGTTTTRSARCTCSASTRPRTALGLGRALTAGRPAPPARPRARPGHALRRRVQRRPPTALYQRLGFARWSTDVLFTRLLLT